MGDDQCFAAFALFYPARDHFTKEFAQKERQQAEPVVHMMNFYGTDARVPTATGKAVPELKSLPATKYGFHVTTGGRSSWYGTVST